MVIAFSKKKKDETTERLTAMKLSWPTVLFFLEDEVCSKMYEG